MLDYLELCKQEVRIQTEHGKSLKASAGRIT